MKKADFHKIIREEIRNVRIEESITGWLIDKVANGLVWYNNRKADYQYDALLKSKDFTKMASQYGMSAGDFEKKARAMIARDPKKFAKILAYDYRSSKLHKLGLF